MTASTTRPAPSSSRRIRSSICASSSSTPWSGARRPMASTERPPPRAAAKIVDIFTDGACSGNPGPGGWGALLRYDGHEREILGGEPATTNNRMEMMAAIQALESLRRPVVARLHTDSQYLRDGITRWITSWKKRGWRTADNKPVKNVDLWQRLELALATHTVEWVWVRGHAGHPENERADRLARRGLEECRDSAAHEKGPG